MDIIKLRNAVLDAIDRSSVKARDDEEYFCACVEYSKYEAHETLEVNFYNHGNSTVFYTLAHDYNKNGVSATRRYEEESEYTEIGWGKAIEELRNEFKKIGVEFDGKYI